MKNLEEIQLELDELKKSLNQINSNQTNEIMKWQDEYMENPEYPYSDLGKGIDKIMDSYAPIKHKIEKKIKYYEALAFIMTKTEKLQRKHK